ncbi:MAG: UPF0179 family protein [Candidatus Bathyarchaeia archaeon]
MKYITIIKESQARVGFKFIFEGAAQPCLNCEYHNACVKNLEKGRLYVVSKVIGETLSCKLLGDTGRTVEVMKSAIEIALDAKAAIEGAIIMFKPMRCDSFCKNKEVCFPLGISPNDRIKVLKVKESLKCPIKRELKSSLVELV